MAERYVIPDEPRPSTLSRLVVNPFWPFFAQMLAGSWLALPWYAINGIALGSPTRTREWACLLASALGSVGLVLVLAYAAGQQWLDKSSMQIALLSIVALKMSMAYALYVMQSRSFELWEYFGGKASNGLFVVIASFFVKAKVMAALASSPILAVVLG